MAAVRDWTFDGGPGPRQAPPVPKPRSFWRAVVLPCAKIGVGGLLAVGYLLVSARVSALEVQRADLQKRIEVETVRRGELQHEYQRVTGPEAVKGYSANLGLQDRPQATQTVSVRGTVPSSQAVATRYNESFRPASASRRASAAADGRSFAQMAP